MFERFTDRARHAVVLAQQEAVALRHDYIGTEHLLLGLLREGDGVAARALHSLGISSESVRAKVLDVVGPGEHTAPDNIPFTARAKAALELSLRHALQLGHNYIGTEHILLGLIAEAEGVAADVLTSLGAELSSVRGVVVEQLSGYSPRIGAAAPAPFGAPRFAPGGPDTECAFCNRELDDVARHVRGATATICDECVATAVRVLATEPGSGEPLPPRLSGDPLPTPATVGAIQAVFAAVYTSDTVEQVLVTRVHMTDANGADVGYVLTGAQAAPMMCRGRAERIGDRWQPVVTIGDE
ncbi:MAG: Clp protease N-terminal domain-containing protein [Actinomycetota bacterium]